MKYFLINLIKTNQITKTHTQKNIIMKNYKIIIQCGMTTKSFILTSTSSEKAYKQAEAIVDPRFIITDIDDA